MIFSIEELFRRQRRRHSVETRLTPGEGRGPVFLYITVATQIQLKDRSRFAQIN